jgi:hypothetical protein
VNHNISKTVVARAKASGNAIALEDLTRSPAPRRNGDGQDADFNGANVIALSGLFVNQPFACVA